MRTLLLLSALLAPLGAQICGDCNGDGVVDTVVDSLVAAQIDVGLSGATAEQLFACDVDSDMTISMMDALRLAQTAVGLGTVIDCPNEAPVIANCIENDRGSSSSIIDYDLSDNESDPTDVLLEWSTDGGATWSVGTRNTCCGDPLTGRATSPAPTSYTVWWDFGADLGTVCQINAQVRLTPMDAVSAGTPCIVQVLDICTNPR